MSTPPLSQPAPDLAVDTKSRPLLERGWNVIVWDDPINLMDYVVFVFQTLLHMPKPKAVKNRLEVHGSGRYVVATTGREEAEHLVVCVHLYGLQATLEAGGES